MVLSGIGRNLCSKASQSVDYYYYYRSIEISQHKKKITFILKLSQFVLIHRFLVFRLEGTS